MNNAYKGASEIFTNRLKEAMRFNGMNHQKLADELGMARTTITAYINGKRTPNVNTLTDICNLLCVSSDYLLGLGNNRQMGR